MKILLIVLGLLYFGFQIVKFLTKRALVRMIEKRYKTQFESYSKHKEPFSNNYNNGNSNNTTTLNKDFKGGEYVDFEEIN